MKKITFLFLFTLMAQTSVAQCMQNVSGFGNNIAIPMYNVTGAVDLTLNADETITLDLGADFMTAAGPDIRAFLVNSNGLTDAQLRNTPIGNLENLQFGLVGSATINQNGAKSFTIPIPAGSNIEDFDKVFFYCLQFDQFWDFGSFTPYDPTNCDLILSTDQENLATIKMFPNPASEQLQLSVPNGNTLNVGIRSIQGSLIQNYSEVTNNQTLDVSSLSSGSYLIELTTFEGNSRVEHLIID